MITSLGKVTEIGNSVINRFLAAEGTSISTCTAWMERVAGQLIYLLNLDSAERTFVYSVDTGLWCEWELAAGGAKFNGIAATSGGGNVYVQDAANGNIYTFNGAVYQDSGSNFTVTLQTPRSNFGTTLRKNEDSLAVIGDTTTGNLVVSVSDDDFVTQGATRNIDMSKKDKKIQRIGPRFFERAHKFTYTDNYALRLQAWVPDISL